VHPGFNIKIRSRISDRLGQTGCANRHQSLHGP
jgi:hypothetical protein